MLKTPRPNTVYGKKDSENSTIKIVDYNKADWEGIRDESSGMSG